MSLWVSVTTDQQSKGTTSEINITEHGCLAGKTIVLFSKLGLHKKERFWQLQISHVSKAQIQLLQMDCTEICPLLKDRKLKECLIMQKLWQTAQSGADTLSACPVIVPRLIHWLTAGDSRDLRQREGISITGPTNYKKQVHILPCHRRLTVAMQTLITTFN